MRHVSPLLISIGGIGYTHREQRSDYKTVEFLECLLVCFGEAHAKLFRRVLTVDSESFASEVEATVKRQR